MTPKVKPKRAGTQWMGYPEQQKKTIRGRSSEANMAPTKNTKETKASKTSQKLANLPRRRERISNQSGRASGHTPRSLPFTTKTGSKHPIIKAPAPHDTCGSCWLCVRHFLTDCGFMFECHFLLLYVNSFQLVTKEKTFQAVFEK